jgi:pimeloyl-ACP methyl ester carboxylesterase
MLFALSAYGQAEDTLLLHTETGIIAGSLIVPVAESPVPVVLIIAGSGPTDRDGNNQMMKNDHLKLLAQNLSDHGIASLRFDKRGIGKSKDASPGEVNMTIAYFAADAAAWVDLLAADDRFSSVTIIGHSIGSLIGMLAAKNSPADAFISIAGAGKPAAEVLRDQLEEQSELVLQFSEPILESLERGETVDTIDPLLMALFRPSVQPYLMNWMAYDPANEIAKLEIPVMIVQGTTDIQVSVEQAKLLAEANPASELLLIEGMNHVLKTAEAERAKNLITYYNPDLPVVPLLIERIAGFIGDLD